MDKKALGIEKEEVKIITRSAIPFYAVAVVWVLCSIFLPMYRIRDFVIAIIAAVVVFIVAEKFAPKKETVVYRDVPMTKTGDPEVDAIIVQGTQYITQIKEANAKIDDEALSNKIEEIEDTATKILRALQAQPSKQPQLRKFMNYYLPTTLKLLNTYHKLEVQDLQSENVSATMSKIQSATDDIAQAFKKQLDNMFSHEKLDISTDITVLENMLSNDGLLQNTDFDTDPNKITLKQ